MRVIDQEPPGTLAGVILLTDGGNNAGVDPAAAAADPASLQGWQLVTTARRPTDPRDNLRLYKAIP